MADGPPSLEQPAQRPQIARSLTGRLGRLILKELREILRDRRTIITLLVMPLLIYPLLAIVFQRFLMTSLNGNMEVVYVVGVDSPGAKQKLEQQLELGKQLLEARAHRNATVESNQAGKESEKDEKQSGDRKLLGRIFARVTEPGVLVVDCSDADLEAMVESSQLHVGIVNRQVRQDESKAGLQAPFVWELFYREGAQPSEAALDVVESRLQALDDAALDVQLRRAGVAAERPASYERRPVGAAGAPPFSLAALIPLILVLMTVTGAVYPAIDLTAGERERGTLETLIAAPVPRLGLLFAKYIAVLTVAVLTALVNLTGMAITAHSSGLAAGLFGNGMSLLVMAEVLLLLVLFAAFFSAILLAITSYARSFKEAQAYIIPLMLVCLVPGVLCLLPSLQFARWMSVTPLVNIVMLARDLLEGSVNPELAVWSVVSTVIYIIAAIGVAARIFGTDAILYGSPATWSDLVRRPLEPQPAASLASAMLCLAAMFPVVFVLSGLVGGSQNFSRESIVRAFELRALITAAVFGAMPVLVMMAGRVRWSSGLGLRWPGVIAVIGAAVLGASLWPAVHEIALAANGVQITEGLMDKLKELLKQFDLLPLWLLLLTVAIVPAVFEEPCFRGFVFGALRQKLSGAATVIATALLFGLFHEVLFPNRLVSTTAMGLILGLVRLRTRSIVPGVVLHAVNNGLILTVVHYRAELAESGWVAKEGTHLPLTWHAVALLGIVVGGGMILFATRRFSAPHVPNTEY